MRNGFFAAKMGLSPWGESAAISKETSDGQKHANLATKRFGGKFPR